MILLLIYTYINGKIIDYRSPSPVDAYITEEEIFTRSNNGCHYDYETVLGLKNIYSQV